jgi:hypothetical protein
VPPGRGVVKKLGLSALVGLFLLHLAAGSSYAGLAAEVGFPLVVPARLPAGARLVRGQALRGVVASAWLEYRGGGTEISVIESPLPLSLDGRPARGRPIVARHGGRRGPVLEGLLHQHGVYVWVGATGLSPAAFRRLLGAFGPEEGLPDVVGAVLRTLHHR